MVTTPELLIEDVSKIKNELDSILKTVKNQKKWDRGTELQLEWAINNAWAASIFTQQYTLAGLQIPIRTEEQENRPA